MNNKLFFSLLKITFFAFVSGCKISHLLTHDAGIAEGINLFACDDKNQVAYICFDSLLTDSRCPKGAEWDWQGTALIKISFHKPGGIHQFIMSLKGFPTLGYPSDTTVSGYNIVFANLEPYPDATHPQQQTPSAYFAVTP